MFNWFKSLFANKPAPHPSAAWVAAPHLKVTLDVFTGELHFGNGQSTKLTANFSTLAPLGPASPYNGGDVYFSYPQHALLVCTFDGDLDSFSVDFYEGAPPEFLFNGRTLTLSNKTTTAELIALFGPAKNTIEDGNVTDLEFETADGVLSEWNFEDDMLTYFDVAHFGDDFDEEGSSEDAEASADEAVPKEESTW